MLDWIGRVGAFQDVGDPNGATAKALNWLFATPWWVPGLIAVCVGVGILWMLAPTKERPNGNVQPPEQPVSRVGMGGNAYARGQRSRAHGGSAGESGLTIGGGGGHADACGDESFALGGSGSNSGQSDGRGGRRSLSAGEVEGMPTALWPYGYGGYGTNTSEYNRRLEILTVLRREYAQVFPVDVLFIEAGIDPVPERWINARLGELGEPWRVTLEHGGYKMI